MRLDDQHRREERILALARAQHTVLHLRQLVELGLTARATQQRVKAGRLFRIYRGVYSLVPKELLSPKGRLMAAVLACGPGAVISHRNAAELHELRRSERTKIDVTIPRRSVRTHPGIDLHRSTTLTEADVMIVDGIPCTTITRTLLDLADVLKRRPLERAFDQAAILEVLNLIALQDQLERNASRAAAKRVQRLLAEHLAGSTATWSELEEVFLDFTRTSGFPDAEANVWIDPGDGGPAIRVDFVWRKPRISVQVDGWKFHRTRSSFEHDRRSDQRLSAAGWRPVRTTWRQLKGERAEIAPTFRALLSM